MSVGHMNSWSCTIEVDRTVCTEAFIHVCAEVFWAGMKVVLHVDTYMYMSQYLLL